MRGPRAIGVTVAMIGGLHLAAAVWSHAARVRSPASSALAAATESPASSASHASATPHEGTGARLFLDKGCVACHSLRGQGGRVGPALDDVEQRISRGQLLQRLRDPASVRPGTIMPRIPLRDDERDALADFLLQEIHR